MTRFLSVPHVLQAQAFSIARTGGMPGLRDAELLESAVQTPRQEFGGEYLHEGIAAQAAAYLYHIAANHPFADGNKRAAALAALLFLDRNGVDPLPDPSALEPVVWAVADGTMRKEELTDWFRAWVDQAGIR